MSEAKCHPEQYRGEWAIEPKEFDRLVGIANRAMDSGYLSAGDVVARREEAAAAGEPSLYAIDAGGVATVHLNGPLTKYQNSFQALFGGTSTVRARQALREAARDPDVRGVLLVVDSPGGTVAGTTDLADEVARADARKPVYAYLEDLAASGALWAVLPARRIYANEGALVGSIGVYSTLIDSSEAAGKQGIKVRVVSTHALKGGKGAGVPITDAVLAEEQRVVDSIGELFIAAVARGRRMSDKQARALATGQVWIASEAKGLGLVDAIATLEDVRQATSVAGSRKVAATIAAKESTMRTADVVYEDIRREARTLFPKLTEPRAIAEFTRTPRGADLVRELKAAPAEPPEAA